MGARFPHDPTTRRDEPNGAVSFTSYRGLPGARIEACPVDGTERRLTVYATDRAGGACTRIRGRYVAGRLERDARGPRFLPAAA